VIFDLFRWVQSTDFMTFIRESGLTYPLIMSTHLACIAVFGGMIVITDLRLLGAILQNRPIADVINGLRWWKRLGFVIMVSMGIMLAGSKATEYYPNPYFWTKMSFLTLILIHALIFRPRVYNHPEKLDASPVIPARAKVAGALSLVLWTGVVCAGRLIGYYEPPQQKGHIVAVNTR
jgi:heme A synthase